MLVSQSTSCAGCHSSRLKDRKDSGKSTQVQRLAARLERSGVQYLVTREPGGTPIGETIRELLQFAPHNSAMTPETELFLFEASRSQLVRETIKPALRTWLVRDRRSVL